MNSRERLAAVLNRREADRICFDLGAGGQTGMGVCAVHRLRQALLGDQDFKVKVCEPYQMLGEIDPELRAALKVDVVGIHPRYNMFGFTNDGEKPFVMCDGTEVLVPESFRYTTAENGDIMMYPEGDVTAGPSGRMPVGGYFFDSVKRQAPLVEAELNFEDNCEEFGVMSDEEVNWYKEQVDWYWEHTDSGIYLTFPGLAFGDIALVPGPWLKHPKGIRDVEEWYISTAMRRDYVYQVFERQCEIGLKNIEKMTAALGDRVQVVFVSGTDFGTQRGPFLSPQAYRDLYKPFQKQINDKIHELSNWKIFIHSCGGIAPLLDDMAEAGFDVLNPVQCSACDMDPRRLKEEYGDRFIFWGGGVDTQKTLPFGTPEEVYQEVSERIRIFGHNGGYVFNSIHNVQSNVPTENLLALVQAVQDNLGL